MAEILYGKPVVDSIKADLRKRIGALRSAGKTPGLAILRAGERPDDISYERRLEKLCDDLGINHFVTAAKRTIRQEVLEYELKKFNDNPAVNGILVFRPFPDHIDDEALCSIISLKKDIDCMNPDNLKMLFTGHGRGFAPCTPEAVIELLKFYGYELDGTNVVIINRSLVVGKPLSMMFLENNSTVTICHSHTKNLADITRAADIIVTGTGKAEYLGPEYVNEDSVVVDVGIDFTEDGRMTGDVDFDPVAAKAAAVTPVPRGVGGITSSILLRHIVESAEMDI